MRGPRLTGNRRNMRRTDGGEDLPAHLVLPLVDKVQQDRGREPHAQQDRDDEKASYLARNGPRRETAQEDITAPPLRA
jgi:hypothetical protein